MDVLLFLIPLSMMIALLGIVGIFWSIKHNQFDDLKANSQRVLHDEVIQKDKDSNNKKQR